MKKSDDVYIEVEIVEEEQRALIQSLIEFGNSKQVAPIKLLLAMIKLIDVICDSEGIDIDTLLSLHFDNEADSTLH